MRRAAMTAMLAHRRHGFKKVRPSRFGAARGSGSRKVRSPSHWIRIGDDRHGGGSAACPVIPWPGTCRTPCEADIHRHEVDELR